MVFQAFMGCLRVVLVVVIFGAIGYVIYDNLRPHEGNPKNPTDAAPPLAKAGDMATVTGNTVACPVVEDILKFRDLLRASTDRQPAATYANEHRCPVLTKFKDYRVETYSARYAAVCLQVPGQKQCQWMPLDGLTIKPSAPPPAR
jgi:hypothetical protein